MYSYVNGAPASSRKPATDNLRAYAPNPIMSCVPSPLPATAVWRDGLLTLDGPLFHEVWRAEAGGALRLVSFHRRGGPEWISPQAPATPASADAPLSTWPDLPRDEAVWTATFSTQPLRQAGLDTTGLVAEVRFAAPSGCWRLHRFQLHPLVAGTVHRVFGPEIDAGLAELAASAVTPRTGRMRIKDNGQMFATLPGLAHPLFALSQRHLLARAVNFTDQTDHHSNLVFTREFLVHPGERCLPVTANLVCIEDPASAEGDGILWLLQAPLPHVRKTWSPYFDFLFAFQAGELVATACPAGYALARLAYSGGRTGATLALHALQRAFYDAVPAQPGRLLSNTWGDRAGAAHLSEAFVKEEIAAAQRLGVEIVQIDDGWQKGATVNTVAAGGVWNGFWAADPEFWTPHAGRFPRGLAPLVEAAGAAGVALGLWYAPDSTNDLANWERDAAQLLRLWREHRIAHFKLDALKLHSRLAETRFHALCDRALAESRGEISFDFDATAERRPTYWGRPGGGSLFLENRFTEQAGYHPHQTLRSLWSLAHYVRPERIRVEFLNPARNEGDYADDPLRPAAYPPEYLFAIAFAASPLAWFEVCRVPSAIVERWRPLIAVWKEHRAAFQRGAVLPIGHAPNGHAWTGFVSLDFATDGSFRCAYALVFRELTVGETTTFELPPSLGCLGEGSARRLAGEGTATLAGGKLCVHLASAQRFMLAHWPA